MISPLADLDRHAAERPAVTAISTPRGRYSFGELRDLTLAVAERLRGEGVTPRHVVALDLPAALEWIVDLALLRIATRSVSVRGVPGLGTLQPDALISSPGASRGLAPIMLAVDDLWLAGATAAASGADTLVDYPRPDSIVRLMMTSGTTGTPRAAAYAANAFEHRRLGLDAYWTDARPELDFMPLSTTGGFHTAVAALRHGEAFRAVDRIDAEVLRFAADDGIRVLAGSPQQLATALDVVEESGIQLPALEEVRMAGAAPGPALLRRIRELLAVPIRIVYGSTEGGGMTSRMLDDEDSANVGSVLPGFELQVVDESGMPVAPGVEGTLRYRGPGMVSGYLENGTVAEFPGGWFVPGDLASIDADGSVRLSGRASEIVNIGGLKVDPDRVDELARSFPGVTDAAAFPVERASGRAELGLAVVGRPGVDLRALDRRLRELLPVGHPTAYWAVSEIPRNRMGKVERGMLAQTYARVVGG
ncbi:class I adenylate-forming enzyme family protein [Salinibacterium soli]|uniref:Class I adenylate-forming enzyme family protein n=1 Tax=Antiquaquibacter soli TaxID=3064523 RepID=A0ABT9BNX1_9MICO|nr:class I adenylate-forming enzyme family protein [Protaetiibacter sp. WY-16]MDO7882733.1 class I adenylate-forming enzyme family protein [Protaetiibacter sp. WY-16]